MQLSEIQKISAPENIQFKWQTCDNADHYWSMYLLSLYLSNSTPVIYETQLHTIKGDRFDCKVIQKSSEFHEKNLFIVYPFTGFLADNHIKLIKRPITKRPLGRYSHVFYTRERFVKQFKLTDEKQWFLEGAIKIFNSLQIPDFNENEFKETISEFSNSLRL